MSRDEKKAESRRRILESAREVFFRDGFMKANLDEVAEKAGVAKGTLYRYFESKADLYVAVLTRNHEIFHDLIKAASERGDNAVDRVRSIARFYFAHWLDQRAAVPLIGAASGVATSMLVVSTDWACEL